MAGTGESPQIGFYAVDSEHRKHVFEDTDTLIDWLRVLAADPDEPKDIEEDIVEIKKINTPGIDYTIVPLDVEIMSSIAHTRQRAGRKSRRRRTLRR